jgi:Putative zinc-finger
LANRLFKVFVMDYPLRRSCKEVASMVVAMQDRDLSLKEAAQLRLHMAICKACPGFANQFLTMKSAMHQWRNYAGDDPAESSSSVPASSAK